MRIRGAVKTMGLIPSKKNNEFNMDNFTIHKIKEMTMYNIQCPDCGWNKNSLEDIAYYCPKCGKDLKTMTLKEIKT